MSQMSFADAEFTQKRRRTRKERFLARMDELIPWDVLEGIIEPHYPKAGNGRKPYPLSTMLRVHFLQQWYDLSDPAAEDALYEVTPMRQFAKLSLDAAIPDESTIMNFRHLLERKGLGEQLLAELNKRMTDSGVMLKQGTLVDASIIEAPSSTKNASGERDPEMHQTKKGNQWHFGFKAHIGVDAYSGMTRVVRATAANVHDLTVAQELLCGKEELVFGDSGYRGIEKRLKHIDENVTFCIAAGPGKLKAWKARPRTNKALIDFEHAKASIRAAVEHPFQIIKCRFHFRKTRYRGMAKNHNKLCTLFALANIVRLDQLLRR